MARPQLARSHGHVSAGGRGPAQVKRESTGAREGDIGSHRAFKLQCPWLSPTPYPCLRLLFTQPGLWGSWRWSPGLLGIGGAPSLLPRFLLGGDGGAFLSPCPLL